MEKRRWRCPTGLLECPPFGASFWIVPQMQSSVEFSMEVPGSAKGLTELPDLCHFLNSWPYDPENNVRIGHSIHGRDTMLVRQPMGLDQYGIDGLPVGRRRNGMDSVRD